MARPGDMQGTERHAGSAQDESGGDQVTKPSRTRGDGIVNAVIGGAALVGLAVSCIAFAEIVGQNSSSLDNYHSCIIDNLEAKAARFAAEGDKVYPGLRDDDLPMLTAMMRRDAELACAGK